MNPILFVVIGVFVLVVGFLLFVGGFALTRWIRNNRSPVLSVPAKVVTLRQELSVSRVGNAGDPTGAHGFARMQTPCFFVKFRTEDGAEPEFRVPYEVYAALSEEDEGTLRCQGTRFLSFEI